MDDHPGSRSSTTVGALPLRPPVVVSEGDPLSRVARSFVRRAVSCALLREAPLRVVTERDLMRAWLMEVDRDDPVGRVATEQPFWVPVHASLAEAAAAMVNCDVRHLVVIDGDRRPLGVVSMADVFSVLMQAGESATMYATFAASVIRAGLVHARARTT